MDRELDQSERWRHRVRAIAPLAAATVLVVAGLVVVLGWLEPSVRKRDIRIATVDRGEVEATIDATGTVIPAFERVMSSPVEARIVRILRKPGALVEKGDEIVDLDTQGSRVGLEQLDEQIAQKNAEKTSLETGIEQEMADLQARIEQKDLDLQILVYKAKQSKTLRHEGLIAEETLRQAEVTAKKAEIELGQLRASVASTKRKNDAQIASVVLDLRILKKQRAEAARQLELASMRADRDGVVTWVTPEEGATVQRGDVIARIADLSSYRIESTVSDIHARELAVGLPAVVPIGEETLRGSVSSVDPTIVNGVVTFIVDLDDASNAALRNNLRVDVRVVTGHRDDVLRLRRGPHISDAKRQDLFVVDGDEAVRTPVDLGLIGRDYVEITGGLEANQSVIISDMQDRLTARTLGIK